MSSAVMPTYARADLRFVKGEAAWLVDESGRRYLDFGAGVAVNSLGHAHPELVKTLQAQAGELWHVSNLYDIPAQEKLAEGLVDATFADCVFFSNSGAEAMEAAVKTARKYHYAKGDEGRTRMLTFNGAFHGRTIGMISAVGTEKLTTGFAPLLDGFEQLPFGDLDALDSAMGSDVAAVIVEPVQGEGGIQPLPEGMLKSIRALCDQHGALLILDEVQCGMGRTGKLFAHEWSGITPDIMAVAKGIGGGFPLGACLATSEAAIGMTPGTHGSTYGGNPLACAVGAKVLEIIHDEAFLDSVRAKAGRLRQGLEGLVASHPDVFELVRGEGLMLGLKCVVPNMDVVNGCYDQELLTVPGGDNVVRLLPPLTITDDDIDQALRRLDQTAQKLGGK